MTHCGKPCTFNIYQNPSAQSLDSGTIYNRAKGFWICSSFKDHYLFAPCQTLLSRFATFSSPYVAECLPC
jgi:hypothetical protein